MLSSKILAGKTTALNTELFIIRLEISKTTSIEIKHIILITDSLGLTRKTVDLSVHSGQAHSLTIYSALKSFFSGSFSHRIEF